MQAEGCATHGAMQKPFLVSQLAGQDSQHCLLFFRVRPLEQECTVLMHLAREGAVRGQW